MTLREFQVVHPLDDVPERKIDMTALGPMRMTPGVRVSLLTLRAYLLLMSILVVYHVLELASMPGH